ncbi:hypothetical protein [Nocardia wallacei]|uniref:hypothetical protein n=1 Tax=Nocardia TaxID=1817 RepID=UPI0024548C1C|nr:hypothetical protein [Nocardia wallacei]
MAWELGWLVPVSVTAIGSAAVVVIAMYWVFVVGYERQIRARFRGGVARRRWDSHYVGM